MLSPYDYIIRIMRIKVKRYYIFCIENRIYNLRSGTWQQPCAAAFITFIMGKRMEEGKTAELSALAPNTESNCTAEPEVIDFTGTSANLQSV